MGEQTVVTPVADPFARHPLVIVASSSHPLAGQRRIAIEQLAQESFLIREKGSGTRTAMEQAVQERGARTGPAWR